MDHNLFRDYCKAENSDDEEANFDLQSRLYAEIYYGPKDIESMDVKPVIKSETVSTDNEALQRKESIITTPNPSDNTKKDNYDTNHRHSENSSTIIDNKSNIKAIVTPTQTEPVYGGTGSQNNLSISSIKTLEHSIGNIGSIKNDADSMMCHNVKNAKTSLDHQNVKTERNVAEPEVETESKEQLSLKLLNPKTPVQSSCNEEKKEVTCTERNSNENSDNILTKYEFAKLIINKLYLRKYVDLEERLQEIEKEKEMEKEKDKEREKEECLKQAELKEREEAELKEREEAELKEREEAKLKESEEKRKQQQTRNSTNVVDEADTDSRYKVQTKNEKPQKTPDCCEEIVLLSETDSNSEDSILEVPIPPKPLPPVINLNDSDESSESSSDSDSNVDPFIVEHKNDTSKITDDKHKSDKSSVINTVTEDIMLNCTEVQKCASSIEEIREASKSVQSQPISNETQLGILYYPFSDDENTQDIHLPSISTANSNVVYERDKNESINFAEDVPLSNFVNVSPKESTSNKRRRDETDNETGNNAEQNENTGNESKRTKLSPKKPPNNDKNKKQTWEEYFFAPLSDNLKAFYNESRGQENFDIREIQNKMSRDPRLWTILDEDLIPDLARQQRYWNSKCNYCQFEGHKRRNCPELTKPPRCHMCGSEGHTESRCPEKMCLTCGKKQGTFRKTCESCRTLYCNMCNAVGHKSTECPDLWRRFHQTTQNCEIEIPESISDVMKPPDLLYCCNCTKRGHDSSTCNEYRWSQHFPTPAYVSNYVDGPKCENAPPAVSSKSEDVIPLAAKTKKHKYMSFLQGQENLDGCFVVYSYGAFYIKEPKGEEVKRNLVGDQIHASQLTNFLKGRIVPAFLDQLKKIIKFEIKIYYDSQRSLMIRIRSMVNVAPNLCDIFVFWLKLSDEDKHLMIYTDFPYSKRKMANFLKTKLNALRKDLDHPESLHQQIKQLKEEIPNVRDPRERVSMSKQLMSLQEKFTRAFHAMPKQSAEVKRLRKCIKYLNTSTQHQVEMSLYFNIMYVYNKIFLPRTLTNAELTRFLKKYQRSVNTQIRHNQKYMEKKNEECKKQKKQKPNPYESFVQKITNANESKGKTNTCNITDTPPKPSAYQTFVQEIRNYNELKSKTNACNINDAAQSTKSSEKHNKQTSTVISTTVEHPVVTDTVQYDNVTEGSIGNTRVENFNMEANINESSTVYPIERISLPRDHLRRKDSEVIDTVKNYSTAPSSKPRPMVTRSMSKDTAVRPNLITIPIENTGSLMKHSKKKHSEIEPPQNSGEKSSEQTSDSSKVMDTSYSEQDDAANSDANATKKKKSKKSKKAKTDLDDSLQVTEDQATDSDGNMVNKAQTVIDEALAFSLPHMNKAAEEVQKRISNNNLKQEHINVLQRLINLEKEHQQYVSSFCNYLQ
ncbi:uncharacterized protein LOC117606690 isoform X1 [Osmia lignaria lignaria]|uniref:uncharacterized protein LOC117606690 isoform X1 n=1 Tax=Osmia lignaria lignaria TaxID=1437193 RepID=UPI00402B351C